MACGCTKTAEQRAAARREQAERRAAAREASKARLEAVQVRKQQGAK
jgi:hypothetical protein